MFWAPGLEAYQLFISFVHFIEHNLGNQDCLPSLLRFITGMSSIPPVGVKFSIEILYHVNDDNILPSASACTHKLFFYQFVIALKMLFFFIISDCVRVRKWLWIMLT